MVRLKKPLVRRIMRNSHNLPEMQQLTDPDFDLFLRDPHAVLLKYQNLVEVIVVNCIQSGMFPLEQKRDIIQSVNLHLLEKTDAIKEQYGGTSLFRTYLSAIIRNTCLILCAQVGRRPIPVRALTEYDGDPAEPVDRYSIQLARRLFRAILPQFGRHLPKLIICMKLRLRKGLTEEDIRAWWPRCSPRDLGRLLEKFGNEYQNVNEKQVYAFVSPFFIAAEGKVTGEAAIRKWTVLQLEHIADVLNSAIPGSDFDIQSVELLFEDYFFPFLLRE
ncbi:MAG: hypothetical protein AB1428_09845 [Bacteroidota bacterium]